MVSIELDENTITIRDIIINDVNTDEEITIESVIFKKENKTKKLSYADCIGYISARKNNMKFLTGDKEFENFKNVEFVKR